MVPPKIESSLDNVRSMEDVSLVVRSPNRRRKRSSRSSDDDSSAAAVIILGLLLYNMVDRNNG
jgi:hypothetical protein